MNNENSNNIRLYKRNATNFNNDSLFERFKANAELDDSLREFSSKESLTQELVALEKILKLLKEVKSETQAKKKLTSEIELSYKIINGYLESGAADERDLLNTLKTSTDLRIKAQQKYLGLLKQEEVQRKQALTEAIKLYDKLNNTSTFDKWIKKTKELSLELSNLSQALNLDKIVNGGAEGLRQIRKDTMLSMGLNSIQFNEFKNQLIDQVKTMNINAGAALYNLGDVVTYISNLSDLGVYTTKLAEQQVEAAIVGNKLLGMSVEAQADLIKVVKRSGNNDLLQEQNRVVASLLKSNLDVSKQQLALAAGNTASLLNQMSYLGVDGGTLSKMGVSATAGQAAIISAYGVDTNNAVFSVLSDMYNNVSSDYFAKVGGDKVNNALRSGDYGSALQALMQSDYYKNLAEMSDLERQSMLGIGQATAQDLLIANMVKNSNKMNWDEYNRIANMDQSEAEETLKKIQEEQADALSWQEKFYNEASLFIGQLDWKHFVTLANASFTLYLATKGLEVLKKGFELFFGASGIFSITGKAAFTNFFSGWKAFSSGTISASSALMSALPALVSIGSLVGSGLMILRDIKKADSIGVSKVQAALLGTETGFTNVLWQVGKYLLLGLGAYMLGAPAAIAFGIASVLGVGTGILGSLINKEKAQSAKNAVGDGGSGSALSSIGIGGGDSYTTSAGVNTKPWRISSRFGPRKPVKTKNGMSSSYHKGVDLGRKSGTPIGANVGGIVSGKGYNSGAGNWIAIKGNDGYVHKYMHMVKPTFLEKGDLVNTGQIIGYVGSTGKSTGAHLHYQMESSGKAFNPEPYITRNIMDATETGMLPVLTSGESRSLKVQGTNESTLSKFIAEDTKQKDAVAAQYANYFATDLGVGDGDVNGINGTVSRGFDSLLEKLDSLAARQDDQERILAAVTRGRASSLYKY